jgi:hypothetical protein
MAALTVDVLGMCVVLREGEDGPYALGFLRDPGHLQTVHYQGSDGAKVAALSFWGDGNLQFEGIASGRWERSLERVPFMHSVGRQTFVTKSKDKLMKEFRSIIQLPPGKLTALPAHIGDDYSRWSFGDDPFSLTDRLRYSAEFEGTLALGNKRLSAGNVHLTITSVDRDYGSRSQGTPEEGMSLVEFNHFYRCTTKPGPIPRNVRVPEGKPFFLDPDSPICPIIGVQYE